MENTLAKSNNLSSDLEEKIQFIGKEIFKRVKSSKTSFFDRSFWSSKLMDFGMKDPNLKVQLFRFVDLLPSLKTNEQLSKHIQEYFGNLEGDYAGLFGVATKLGTGNIVGKLAASVAIKTSVTQMARTFIAGENINEVVQKINELNRKKMSFTIDILGEAVLSEKEANHYQNLYMSLVSELSEHSKKWEDIPLLSNSPHGNIPKVNVSVKLSSLYSQASALNFTESVSILKDKLRPILKLAKEKNVFIYIDMEDYHFKDLIFQVFKEILMEDEFINWKDAGIVVQAYLKNSEEDLNSLIDFTKKRKTPISIRLVKGAYWDYETIIGNQNHWDIPVFEHKYETDINYEKLTKILLENYPHVYPAIASHNIRSLACAKAYGEKLSLPKNAVEYQFLFGMADPIKEAFVEMGERVRIYTPFGELIPGMAYLVRRLLENTANESFLRMGFVEGISEEKLLMSPSELGKVQTLTNNKQTSTKNVFTNAADTDFSINKNRELMYNALSELKKELGKKYPLIINNKKIETKNWADSINPSNKKEIIGTFGLASCEQAEDAIKTSKEAYENWHCTSVNERANILFKAAKIMEEKRFQLNALIVLEEGKPWKEADGDVSEAIDFLNYYGLEAIKLFTPEKLISPLGEDNFSSYKSKGVCGIISPWNFPLAILCGMSSAAIACGNTVVIKPAKQASIIASKYVEILIEAGLPPGVCNYLPGNGSEIGNYLVKHPDINLIAFTGSMEVGLSINKLANDIYENQDFVKKVLCEMGGKNAIIIDDDADLDEAVKGVLYSAFGYAGQKCSACSRVIVVKEAYERFLERLVEATNSIKTGDAEDPGSYLGPVIDEASLKNTLNYIEIGKKEGKLITGGEILSEKGFFIKPTIFTEIKPDSRIAQEEIFAPVLAVIKAEDIDHAIEIGNKIKFALTGGIFSRSPGNIQKVKEKFKVGNLYINRTSTGAKVGRQPFGGFKMSGIGSKAGGKDYLLQFVEPLTITENTMRRGFAPQ